MVRTLDLHQLFCSVCLGFVYGLALFTGEYPTLSAAQGRFGLFVCVGAWEKTTGITEGFKASDKKRPPPSAKAYACGHRIFPSKNFDEDNSCRLLTAGLLWKKAEAQLTVPCFKFRGSAACHSQKERLAA